MINCPNCGNPLRTVSTKLYDAGANNNVVGCLAVALAPFTCGLSLLLMWPMRKKNVVQFNLVCDGCGFQRLK